MLDGVRPLRHKCITRDRNRDVSQRRQTEDLLGKAAGGDRGWVQSAAPPLQDEARQTAGGYGEA